MASIFPEISVSIRLPPHEPIFTYNVPSPSLASQLPAFDFVTTTVDVISTWTAAAIPSASVSRDPTHSSSLPLQSQDPSNATMDTMASTPQSEAHGISKGAKIGIIIGITVVVILCAVATTLCALDMRRRTRRKRAERENRDAELNMLESQLRSGRAGQGDKRDNKPRGLWEDLRVGRLSEETRKERLGTDEPDRKSSKGLWERVGEKSNQDAGSVRKDSTIGLEREQEWLPAYMPRERTSIVSSVGSMGFPIPPKPAIPTTFLEGDGRR